MSSTDSSLTPMMRQYREMKTQYPDAILFFRMGDFYEMFGDDAIRAAPLLEVVLTSRDRNAEDPIPMCGVPYHAVDTYIAKLIDRNLKVAICEQLEDPSQARGLVKRGVVRLITPGTLLEENLLTARENNFLACVTHSHDRFGLAFLDVSTGDFKATELEAEPDCKIYLEEISRWSVRELLYPESWGVPETGDHVRSSPLDDWIFSRDYALTQIQEHFQILHLDGFGLNEMPAAVLAIGAMLHYLRSAQIPTFNHVSGIQTYHNDQFVYLDAASRRNLEISRTIMDNRREGSLLHYIDDTRTAMGSRMLKQRLEQPLRIIDEINKRLDEVDGFYNDDTLRIKIRDLLIRMADLERLTSRIITNTASPRDLTALRSSLHYLPDIQTMLDQSDAISLQLLGSSINTADTIRTLLDHALQDEPPGTLKDGGVIKDGYNDELDALRAAARDGKKWIAELQNREREQTGITSLKVRYNKLFGFFIEITNAHLNRVPDNYVRRQTLVNAERYVTPELKEMEEKILGAEEKMVTIELALFDDIRRKIASEAKIIQHSARIIAEIDIASASAEQAMTYRYRRPDVKPGNMLDIRNGRHPVVERMPIERGFVPNDSLMDSDGNRLIVLTGPNMAGKSTYIRQVALIVLMAQAGLFVPADSALIGTVDRIFTRVGASDNLAAGQSTFMVEMSEAANILNNATSKSLVILDEIGRGTSTYDGLSIAWAVAEYLHSKHCRTLFATHYHELTDLKDRLDGVQNFNVVVKEWNDQVLFLRKVVPGAVDKSYGIQVARLAGLPPDVISRAREVLSSLEMKEKGRVPESKSEKSSHGSRPVQPNLFTDMESPLQRALDAIRVNRLTPLDALNTLAKWKADFSSKK
ncbi:DNA mismatch repair protein MutS [bacterium]|nr:DNA mismatch repair protein MutS [candidate division CSSED10-310 bacterium]